MLPMFCSVFLFIVEEYMGVTIMLSFGQLSQISGAFSSHGFLCFMVLCVLFYAVNCYFDCGPTLSLRTYNCDYLVLKMPRVLVTLE